MSTEKEALYARARLNTNRLHAIAKHWTDKYRAVRRERYGDPLSSDDDDNENENEHDDKQGPSSAGSGRRRREEVETGPGPYLGTEKKSNYVIPVMADPLRNLPGILGGGYLHGGLGSMNANGNGGERRDVTGKAGSGMVELARRLKGRSTEGVQNKGPSKRPRQEKEQEEESEEEVGRTGAFKARKKSHAGAGVSSIEEKEQSGSAHKPAAKESKAQGGAGVNERLAPVEEEDDWDGISEDDGDVPAAPLKSVERSVDATESTDQTNSKKKKRKKKKKKKRDRTDTE